jgi:hypothetical protein
MKVTIVANNNNWTTLSQQIAQLSDWFKTYSSGRLEVVFDMKQTAFANVPLQDWQGAKSVDVNWYRQNITPLATGEATLLLLNPDQWTGPQGTTFGTMTYGDPGKPVRCEVMAVENEYVVDAPVFVHRAYHEICHALFCLTGQKDAYTDQQGKQQFVVHDYLYQDPPKRKELLDLIDYQKLQQALIQIKPMEKIKIRAIGWNDAEKGLYFPFDTPERQQALLAQLTNLFPDYELDSKEWNLGKRPWN